MTLGPNQILKTPVSGHLVKIATILSGNTFGARRWTDGKMIAPHLPDNPLFRRHPQTGEAFWCRECVTMARESVNEAEVPFAEAVDQTDLLAELNSFSLTADKERYLRVQLWWMWNDPDRDSASFAARPAGFEANLRRLLEQLAGGSDDNSRLMMAEVWRQLGEHEESEAILAHPFDESFVKAVNLISAANRQRDTRVREIC